MTTLTTEDLALIRASFAQVRRVYELGSTLFYDMLFARDPSLRQMFRDDLAGQGMKFMTTLGMIVEHMDDPVALADEIRTLANGHQALGVMASHYVTMGAALRDTFRALLGEGYDDETDAAWTRAYDLIAAHMVAVSEQVGRAAGQ